jgi:hypothetical protein
VTIAACPPNTPVEKGVVEFDVEEWRELYPGFALVADGLLERDFVFAEVLLKNTCCSRVVAANKRQTLLYLLVAHIASLFDLKPTPAPVGRLSEATEGSVSVGFDFGTITPNEAWYAQTQFGAMYWAMTAGFRTFVYVPAPITCADIPGLATAYPYPFPGGGCG